MTVESTVHTAQVTTRARFRIRVASYRNRVARDEEKIASALFWCRYHFLCVFYIFRERHYLKRTKAEIKFNICIFHWICYSKP